ncbi:MAG: endonuclease/exonuclease/phosphatase family protein [Elusimicrobiales bacterium]|jgi:endonuclease/exonuclease/phosphatase family metal-dependent hydrolase
MPKIKLSLLLFFALRISAQGLTAMTYNIRLDTASDGENDWAHRKEFCVSQLRFYAPDIFGVQEATPGQVTDLSAALAQYGHVGVGRDGPEKGEASSVYYKKDRFELETTGTFWLSETPDKISKGWDAAFNRVCTYALFKDRRDKKTFWVFNTHLDHVGEEARTRGLRLILSKMAELNAKKYPVILMGDFNTEPGADRIAELKKVMNDAREISEEKPFGPSGTFNGFDHAIPATKLIDYIFVSRSGGMKVKKYAVLSDSKDLKYPSDHFPVFVEIY